MTPYETAIAALSEALEMKLEIASDRLCDVEVDGRLVILRPMGEAEESLMTFALVADAPTDGKLPAEVKDRALSMNLFGAETLGGHLGLFGESIVLSAPTIEATGLTAESLAENLLAFSRFARRRIFRANPGPEARRGRNSGRGNGSGVGTERRLHQSMIGDGGAAGGRVLPWDPFGSVTFR